ncbi:MAG: hypothetical protein V4723_07485 [Pseudomonadota bacterium]
MLSKRYAPLNSEAPLTLEANKLLAEAVAQFDGKQQRIRDEWRTDSYVRSEFNPGDASLRLDFADGRWLRGDAQLIGTFCASDNTFEWAWNNPRFPSHITRDSLRVRNKGEELGLAYLRKGMIPIKDETFLSYLCAIALKVTSAEGIFRTGGDDVHIFFAVRNGAWT